MSKFLNLTQRLIIFPQGFQKSKSLDIGLWEAGGKDIKTEWTNEKNLKKKIFFFCGDFTPFMSKSFQIWDHLFQLTFPKDSKNLKKFGHCTSERGGKKTVNRSEKHQYKKTLLSKAKFARKTNFFCAPLLHPLFVKVFKSETISFHYFTPRILNL